MMQGFSLVWRGSRHAHPGSGFAKRQESGLCLAMLAQRQDAFFGLSEAAGVLRRELESTGTTQVRKKDQESGVSNLTLALVGTCARMQRLPCMRCPLAAQAIGALHAAVTPA